MNLTHNKTILFGDYLEATLGGKLNVNVNLTCKFAEAVLMKPSG